MNNMKDFNKNDNSEVTCETCKSEITWIISDLRKIYGENDYYYFLCPVCNNMVFVDKTPSIEKRYKKYHKSLKK